MDPQLAKQMEAELVGKRVSGWLVQKLINNGKSAAVFLAEKGGIQAALKIFDRAIVARYGRAAQLERVHRECSLIGKEHPNLVRTLDGGEHGDLLFIVMEYFDGENLADALLKIPAANVRPLISQIASAAKFLEECSFAHRDIKPENIGVSHDFTTAKLLDLGVIRPFDLSNITDVGEQYQFVATLQYSPPELLFGEQERSPDGWRAITFYQLGGVLHDLLVRKPLFSEFKEPYPLLVRAIMQEDVHIKPEGEDTDLRLLAESCLLKAPQQRLAGVTWDAFVGATPTAAAPLDAARRRIAQYGAVATARVAAAAQRESEEDERRTRSYDLQMWIRSAVVDTCKAESFPPYTSKTIDLDPYILRTLFKPSAKVGLLGYFALYCVGTVIDPRAGVIELQLSSCLSPIRDLVPTRPDPSLATTIKGPLKEQDIRNQVQEYLLLAYSDALDKSAGAIQWLKPGSTP